MIWCSHPWARIINPVRGKKVRSNLARTESPMSARKGQHSGPAAAVSPTPNTRKVIVVMAAFLMGVVSVLDI